MASSLDFMSSTPLPTQQSSGATTTATVAKPTTAPTPAPSPVITVPKSTTPPPTTKPPAVVTAQPAVKQATQQIAAVTQKETAAQTQAKAKAAADLAAKNAADAAAAATSGPNKYAQGTPATVPPKPTAPAPSAPPTSPPKSPTSPADTTKPTTPTETPKTPEQAAADAIKAADDRAQAAYEQHKKDTDAIRNGTFPLTPDQQARLDAISASFNSLIEQQKAANKNYEASVTTAGIRAGRNMYAPEVELGNVNAAVSAGVKAVADINAKMMTALDTARRAITHDNMEMLDASYKDLMDFETQKRKSIDDTYTLATKELERAQKDYDNMKQDLVDMASVGKKPEDFSPDFFAKVDEQRKNLGLSTYDGYSEDLYKLQYEEKAETKKSDDAKKALDTINILDKLGKSGEIEVGGVKYTYQGYNSADEVGGNEVDKDGRMKYWTFNKRTKTSKSYDLGIMKPEDGWETMDMGENGMWSINSRTGESMPINVSNGRKAWDDGPYAKDEIGPCLPESKNRGQCGAMNNYFYDKGVVGDTLKSKLDPLAKYQITDPNDIRAGMSFVQSTNSNTGHIGFVESVGVDKTGGKERPYITVFESNWHGDGKIDHGRKIYLDDPTLKMISDYPAPKLPPFGSDTEPQILKKSTASTKVLSPDELSKLKEQGYDAKPGMTMDDVANLPQKAIVTPEKIEKANEVLDLIKDLRDDWVGRYGNIGPIKGITPGLTTIQTDFRAKFKRLQSMLTIENMGIMKGVLSDKDMEVVSSASSGLNLRGSDKAFGEELDRIAKKMEYRIANPASEDVKTVKSPDGSQSVQYDLTDPDQKAEYEEAKAAGWK